MASAAFSMPPLPGKTMTTGADTVLAAAICCSSFSNFAFKVATSTCSSLVLAEMLAVMFVVPSAALLLLAAFAVLTAGPLPLAALAVVLASVPRSWTLRSGRPFSPPRASFAIGNASGMAVPLAETAEPLVTVWPGVAMPSVPLAVPLPVPLLLALPAVLAVPLASKPSPPSASLAIGSSSTIFNVNWEGDEELFTVAFFVAFFVMVFGGPPFTVAFFVAFFAAWPVAFPTGALISAPTGDAEAVVAAGACARPKPKKPRNEAASRITHFS
mmetsp:Transcript_862/g.1966  ORF Transcript_862/g.1966 Transcript_862/m.1966 type:complete len:271 (+) Transcript_862:665-1477(+)